MLNAHRGVELTGSQSELSDSPAVDAGAILDALPDAIAVIDERGVIVSVNRAWRMFAIDNGGGAATTGVGVDYLAVCDRAAANGSQDGASAATGLRAVLAGETVESDLEYPCPSPAVNRWFLVRTTPLAGGKRGALVSHVNITRRKAAEAEMESQASKDPLTGLANRSLLRAKLTEALEVRHSRGSYPNPHVGVLSLDLDGFKPVNDTYGHAAGDEVLCIVADRLSDALRPQDTAARPGGDEFAVIAPRIDAIGLTSIAARITAALGEPYPVHGHLVTLGASVGAYLASPGEDVAAALEAADANMYATKRRAERAPL